MKALVDRVHNAGGGNFTVNFLIIAVIVTLSCAVLGLLFIAGFETIVHNALPAPWVTTMMGTLLGIIGALLVANHATSSAVNVQSTTVREQQALSKPIVDAAAQSTLVNAQTMQAVLQAMAVINQIHAQSTSDTATAVDSAAVVTQAASQKTTEAASIASQAITNNTQATQVNTQEMQKENKFHDNN